MTRTATPTAATAATEPFASVANFRQNRLIRQGGGTGGAIFGFDAALAAIAGELRMAAAHWIVVEQGEAVNVAQGALQCVRAEREGRLGELIVQDIERWRGD